MNIYLYIHIHIYIYINIYVYLSTPDMYRALFVERDNPNPRLDATDSFACFASCTSFACCACSAFFAFFSCFAYMASPPWRPLRFVNCT